MSSRDPIDVAVLGATGAVGQTFIELLDGHPFFRVAEVAASERSAGQRYAEATRWRGRGAPGHVGDLAVATCDPSQVRSRVVFSALDSSVAGEVEEAFAQDGAIVLSNAKNHRMAADVPLVIPEVNADHLGLIDHQRSARGWSGAIVTNANCAATVAAMALAPLHEAFGLRAVFAMTMQAVSGAGYPGVPSLDILGNVVPHIGGEEPKIEEEVQKLLGRLGAESVEYATFDVSAHANRVAVEHGHTVCMSIGFDREVAARDVTEAVREWRGAEICRGLPSAPDLPLVLRYESDRPQPRRDVMAGSGMSVSVGRIRRDAILDVKLVAMGHNTIRGAAGGSVLNAEVMGRMGLLPGVEAGAW